MDDLISLADVSARTGVSMRTLRQWCATGRLYCEKDGAGWMIRETDLALVAELAVVMTPDSREPVALIAPVDEPLKVDLASELARRLGLAPATVAMSSLVIDGQEYAVAVWKNTDGTGGLADVQQLAAELGGSLLDGDGVHATTGLRVPRHRRTFRTMVRPRLINETTASRPPLVMCCRAG